MKRFALIILSAMLALCLCACGDISNSKAQDSEQPQPALAQQDMTVDVLVRSVFEDGGTYTDSYGNEYSYSYSIPALSAETEDAQRLNQALLNKLHPIINDEINAMGGNSSLTVERVDYLANLNGSIVSIVARVYYPSDYIDYFVVNYDAASGCGGRHGRAA